MEPRRELTCRQANLQQLTASKRSIDVISA